LAPFADVIAAGEGEVLVPTFERAFQEATGRADLLRRLAMERGFYVPAFFEPEYGNDKVLAGFTPIGGSDIQLAGKKTAVKTTERLAPRGTCIFRADPGFGCGFRVGGVRGCPNLCRFGWAGYNFWPVLSFPADRILELAQNARTHSNRAGLVSIALCDHPEI